MEELKIKNYKYNENILKILISGIDRILAVWNISEEYNNIFKTKYGDDFLNKTKEILILKNLSNHTEKRIELTEYTNNYYIKYDYSNAIYQVELIRIGVDDEVDYGYKFISNKVKTPTIKIGIDKYKPENIIFKDIKNGDRYKESKPKSKESIEKFYNEKIMPTWNEYKKENGYRE